MAGCSLVVRRFSGVVLLGVGLAPTSRGGPKNVGCEVQARDSTTRACISSIDSTSLFISFSVIARWDRYAQVIVSQVDLIARW